MHAVIVVPHGNSSEKNAAMRALGAELIEHGRDFQDAFEHAAALALRERLHFVPSFDEALVRGVASYAMELFGPFPRSGPCMCPSAWAPAFAERSPPATPSGSAPRSSAWFPPAHPRMLCPSPPAGRFPPKQRPPSPTAWLAAFPDPRALAAIQAGVARIVTVDESEIQSAMRHLFTDTHNVAEGAGAASLAALLQDALKESRAQCSAAASP